MSIVFWIVIALVSFVLPATELTRGGKQRPEIAKLQKYADTVGLPLPDYVVPGVAQRMQRRQRGMVIGGISGIVVATITYVIFFESGSGAAPVLVVFLAGAGTALGGAWALAAHRPGEAPKQPVVARVRSVGLSDYVTPGERFGFWSVPAVVVLAAGAGVLLLRQVPPVPGTSPILLAGSVAAAAVATWGIALIALRKVLAAPARSGSEVELAWDDAERADGLRQVVNLTVAVACLSLLVWLICIGEAVIHDGFYQEHEVLSWLVTGASLIVFGTLAGLTAAGPVTAWLTGRRKGYEQAKLWPGGVTV